jgi:predicted nucleic-acid-binding Zn-ribbon protein
MTKTVTSSVSCKHCGATVMVEKQNVNDTVSLTGGITSSSCPKCHRTSSYTYQIKGGQFTQLR